MSAWAVVAFVAGALVVLGICAACVLQAALSAGVTP